MRQLLRGRGSAAGDARPARAAHRAVHVGCAASAGHAAPGSRDRRVAAGQQVAIEGRDRGQAAHHRRRREPRPSVGEVHHVLRARLGRLLRGDEGDHVGRRDLDGVLGDDTEEHLQVVRIGPDGVRAGPPGGELQKRIEQLVPEGITDAAALAARGGTGETDHGVLLVRSSPRGKSPRADQPNWRITRISRLPV